MPNLRGSLIGIIVAIAAALLLLSVSRKTQKGEENYTAVIVEPRKHRATAFVLKNILQNLDDRWSIQFFHGMANAAWLEALLLAQFSEAERSRIRLENLGVANLTIPEYNKLLTSREFTEKIPTEIFLIFQTDSIICPKYKDRINEYLEYDYAGAPWTNYTLQNRLEGGVIESGNGGFSLRRKSAMLDIISWCHYNGEAEDIFFSRGCASVAPRKPPTAHALRFSIENIYHESSFGVHKPWNVKIFQEDRALYKKVCEACEGLEMLESLQSSED